MLSHCRLFWCFWWLSSVTLSKIRLHCSVAVTPFSYVCSSTQKKWNGVFISSSEETGRKWKEYKDARNVGKDDSNTHVAELSRN